MYIVLDKNKMEIHVMCGILEKYEPSPEIKDISDKVSNLRQLMSDFMDNMIEPKLMEINKLIDEQNKKHVQE